MAGLSENEVCLLSAKGLSPGCAGFSKTETGPDGTWVWSLYGDCSVLLPSMGSLDYTFVIRVPGTSVELRAGGSVRRTLTSSRTWQEVSGKIDASAGAVDQAVIFLLRYGTTDAVFPNTDLSGFELLQQYRAGFLDGGGPCDVGA